MSAKSVLFAGFPRLPDAAGVARRRRMDEEDDGDNAEEKNYNTARLQRIKKLLKGTREKLDYYDPRQMLLF